MVSYAADSHTRYGTLVFMPRATYPKGEMLEIREWGPGRLLGQIPQAEQTYNVIGNMNEHQVLIGESTWGGREEFRDPDAILDYGSLIYISHQLKTPLTTLRLYTELDNAPHMEASLEQIQRMENLIQALLRLERLCADGYAFNFAPADAETIIQEQWQNFR